jgi:hypothetical protein
MGMEVKRLPIRLRVDHAILHDAVPQPSKNCDTCGRDARQGVMAARRYTTAAGECQKADWKLNTRQHADMLARSTVVTIVLRPFTYLIRNYSIQKEDAKNRGVFDAAKLIL